MACVGRTRVSQACTGECVNCVHLHLYAQTYTRQHTVAAVPPSNPVHERIGVQLLHAFELAGGSDMNGDVMCTSMRQLRIVYERELLVKLLPVREYSHAYGK